MQRKFYIFLLNSILLINFLFSQQVININNGKVISLKVGSRVDEIGLQKSIPQNYDELSIEEKAFYENMSMPGRQHSTGPSALKFDEENNLYILDCVNNKINMYDKKFSFVKSYKISISSYVSKFEVFKSGFLLFDDAGDFDYLVFYDKNGNKIWSYLNEECVNIKSIIYMETSNVLINYQENEIVCYYDLENRKEGPQFTKSETKINEFLKKEKNAFIRDNYLYINDKILKNSIDYLQKDNNVDRGEIFLGFDLLNNNYFDNYKEQLLIADSNFQRFSNPYYNLQLKDSEKKADYPAVHPSGDIYFLVYSVENSTVELRVLENTWSPETKKKWEEYCKNNESTNVHVNEVKTCNENLRLRQEEATSSAIITTMLKGTKVKILKLGKAETIDGISSNWVQVEVQSGGKDRDGKEIKAETIGWCYGGYLE